MVKKAKTTAKKKPKKQGQGRTALRARRISAKRAKSGAKAVSTHRRGAGAGIPARSKKKPAAKHSGQLHSRSVAKLAASVLSRRAAKVEAQAAAPTAAVVPAKPAGKSTAKSKGTASTKHSRQSASRPGRPHGAAALPGNRPLVKAARIPQFNYMRAPGADHGFDVGDSVEVFCDHEQDGERVRGWIKGVVVQVDNKLVAVQFRSNVFLTDGWMVPDRILWYSLGSDQIRNNSLAKRGTHAVIPEY
jgi:hypothetical protein